MLQSLSPGPCDTTQMAKLLATEGLLQEVGARAACKPAAFANDDPIGR